MGAPSFDPRCATAVLALALVLGGCATEPPREPVRSVLMGREDRVFLVLPLNVAAAMPDELEFFSPIVWKELELYLRAHGKELKTVSRQAARTLWVRSIRQARTGEKGLRAGYDEAARELVAELRKHAEFDVLIAPTLFVREAPIRNRFVRWDGVERELEFEARGLAARSLAGAPLEGVAPAASLHIAVFDTEGEKLHEAQGGLELLVSVRVTVNNPSGTGGSRHRPDGARSRPGAGPTSLRARRPAREAQTSTIVVVQPMASAAMTVATSKTAARMGTPSEAPG